jgi:hypothetical protein
MVKMVGLNFYNGIVGSTNTGDGFPLPPTDAQLMQSSVVSGGSAVATNGQHLASYGTSDQHMRPSFPITLPQYKSPMLLSIRATTRTATSLAEGKPADYPVWTVVTTGALEK